MTLQSLETWRRIAGYNPFHFWGFVHPQLAPQVSSGAQIVRQYEWQNAQALGRFALEAAIEQTESLLREYLLYSVGARPTQMQATLKRNGRIVLPEARIQQLGLVTETLLGTAAIVYSSPDGDAFNERFTATFASALTVDPAGSITVQIPVADRIVDQRLDWRIRPIQITTALNGLTYDIMVSGPSWLLAKPSKYEFFNLQPDNGLDPTDAANFLTDLAFYQQTIDPTKAVQIQRCDGSIDDREACIHNSHKGIIRLDRGSCDPLWWSDPTCCVNSDFDVAVMVNAVMGEPLTDGSVNGEPLSFWTTIIARMACGELACTVGGGLEKANLFVKRWGEDVSRVNGEKEFAFKEQAINNRFGPRRGQISAYNAVEHLGHTRGMAF